MDHLTRFPPFEGRARRHLACPIPALHATADIEGFLTDQRTGAESETIGPGHVAVHLSASRMSTNGHRLSRSTRPMQPPKRVMIGRHPAGRGRREALQALRILFLVPAGPLLGACASLLDRDPVRIDVVGIDPLESQSLEWRFAVRLRIQNPNQTPIEFDGAAVEIDLRGVRLGSGVSDQRGTVPRIGETVLTLPITVPVTALLRQGLAFARNPEGRADYLLRGKLAGPMFGSTRFESRGELTLPALR